MYNKGLPNIKNRFMNLFSLLHVTILNTNYRVVFQMLKMQVLIFCTILITIASLTGNIRTVSSSLSEDLYLPFCFTIFRLNHSRHLSNVKRINKIKLMTAQFPLSTGPGVCRCESTRRMDPSIIIITTRLKIYSKN